MLKIIQFILKLTAKAVLLRYRPKIIGITGSVGKSSTKEAIYSVLSPQFKVRQNIKNYNNEIGLPLTIIGKKSPGKNPLGWISLIVFSLKLIFFQDKNYPHILILEMGIDKPGDMDYLLNIVKCDIGVLTRVGLSHLAHFGSIEKLRDEKGKLITNLTKTGLAILNQDDKNSSYFKDKTKARIISYGTTDSADISSSNIRISTGEQLSTCFDLSVDGAKKEICIHAFGQAFVEAALIAVAIGRTLGLNIDDIVHNLASFKAPRGRMNLIPGLNDSLIIDDSYNSAPQSTINALESISQVPTAGRKIAVLGDMLELGQESDSGHFEVGKRAAQLKFDYLFLVGQQAKHVARGAIEFGLPKDRVKIFTDHESLQTELASVISNHDNILVKGSQGMRMEKIIIKIMANPERAKDLLVRQDEEWENK